MSDYGGKLRLSYGENAYVFDFGTITAINETFQKKVLTVPLTSLSAADAFAVESGNSRAYSINFTRRSPLPADRDDQSDDSTKWSNAVWYNHLTDAVDRWQCLSDGFILSYEPSTSGDDMNPFVPAFSVNGYVRSLTRRYQSDYNQHISGVLTFAVGTMFVNSSDTAVPPASNVASSLMPKTNLDVDFSVLISNSARTAWYPALSKASGINCISNYVISGGVAQPFETITIKIPQKRFNAVMPALIRDVKAGANRIIVSAVGSGSYYVSKFKYNRSNNNSDVTITAYCDATVLRGSVLTKEETGTPDTIIKDILCNDIGSGLYFSEGVPKFTENSTYLHTPFTNISSTDTMKFQAGQNLWYILQVCATYLGCKIFFAEGKAYVVDFRKNVNYVTGTIPAMFDYSDKIIIASNHSSLAPSTGMDNRVVGSVSLGDEGTDTIINTQTINCSSDGTINSNYQATYNTDSEGTAPSTDYIAKYGGMEGNALYTPELIQGTVTTDGTTVTYIQAEKLASSIFDYKREPQQSISFKVKEMIRTSTTAINYHLGWKPCFAVPSRVASIYDESSDTTVDNISAVTGKAVPQKFLLSSYEREYPAGTTTYTFGVVENIDLSTSTQQIVSNLNNVK